MPLALAQKIPHQPDFDLNKKTVLYIFGYIESMKSESVKTIVSAYQKRNDYNVIVLDWMKIVARNYAFQTLPDSIKVNLNNCCNFLKLIKIFLV